MLMRSPISLFVCLALAALTGSACDIPPPSEPGGGRPFTNFETIPTRAVAQSADGRRLFVNNVPDGRLEIFGVTPQGLTPQGSVQVGIDPISLAVRNANEVWVVNHLSDSVSIVDVGSNPPRVSRTLLVGDEPRDIVFAGPGRNRAFITAARRGQNHPDNTANETQVPGLGRADVWVFDANDLGDALGGTPLDIVQLFADKPGALAATPDGSQVFVSIFTSGNLTTVINDAAVCSPNGAGASQISRQNDGPCQLRNGGTSPGGVPAPNTSQVGDVPNPRTGIIVTHDRQTGAWRDGLGRDFRDAVPFTLPDNDVFVLNAQTLQQTRVYQSVGTLNFNLAAHPTNGRMYLATIEAINQNRFVSAPSLGLVSNPDRVGGAAVTADPATGRSLRGHLYESRIAVLQPNGIVVNRHLNKHIDYEQPVQPFGTVDRSVANPQGVAFDAAGETLYVAGLGSNKIVPFNRRALEFDTFSPDSSTHIRLGGVGGPTDLVIDSGDPNRMFVYKRFDNAVAIVDIAGKREVASVPLFNPEPPSVRIGRRFFYDARVTSDNGEANCNVCHPSADKDDLAWDLGLPFAGFADNPNSFVLGLQLGFGGNNNPTNAFNPLKGPMTVLTLRGIKDSGPMFWRGEATNAQDPFDERRNFRQNFGIVFRSLLGRSAGVPGPQMDQLTDWVLTLVPPPNPHRGLDNGLNDSQLRGQGVFTNTGMGATGLTDVIFQCTSCHDLNPAVGNFGASGLMSIEGETQFFKVVQLRTTYDKVGMFGHTFGDQGDPRTLGGPRTDVGPQIRGTGTLHDGSAAGVEEFLTAGVFTLTAPELQQVTDFVYAFPSNVAPVVGQQVTLHPGSGPDALARIDLLQQRAATPYATPDSDMECDLIAKGVVGGAQRGYVFRPGAGGFMSDTGQMVSPAQLRQQARTPGQQVTFTCAPSGAGTRLGVDRNLDGVLDGQGAAPLQAPGFLESMVEALSQQ